MFRMSLLLVVAAAAMLSGCAGMSEQECLVTDWRSVGFEDGAAGRAETAIGNYRQSCSQHGVTPDLEQYRLGHAEGAEVYCRPGRGFEVGRRGGRYQGICPAAVEPEFLAGFYEGRQLYEFETGLRSLDNQITARERRIDVIDKEIASAAVAIIADGTGAERRAELLLQTKALADEQSKLKNEIDALQAERVVVYDELLAYQETLAYGR